MPDAILLATDGSSPPYEENTPDSLRVLIVEDDPADIFLLKQALLRYAPCLFRVVMTGDSAIDFLENGEGYAPQFRADLVILDINLPGKDGGSVLAHLRANREAWQTAVVVLSSLPEQIQRARVPWGDFYVRKPSDLDEYLRLGTRILDWYKQALADAGQVKSPVL